MDFDYKETYATQRKCRMGDALLDYLGDEDVTARRTYEDILSEVDELIEYHAKYLQKAKDLKSLLMGHRPVDLGHSEFLTEDRWSNFPNDNGDYISGLSDDILAL